MKQVRAFLRNLPECRLSAPVLGAVLVLSTMIPGAALHAQEKFRVNATVEPASAPTEGIGATIFGSLAGLSDRDWLVVALAAVCGAAIAGWIGWRM